MIGSVVSLVVCCGIPLALTLRTFEVLPPDYSQQQCAQGAEKIVAALLKYEAEHGHFPPAYTVDAQGKRLHSWRVLILPQLGHQQLYDQIDLQQPWDSTANQQLAVQAPREYVCAATVFAGATDTNYAVVSGEGYVFDGAKTCNMDSITDNLEDTILIIEIVGNTPWMQPADVSVNELASFHDRGGHVGLASGEVKFMLSDMPPEEVEALLTKSGGEAIPVW